MHDGFTVAVLQHGHGVFERELSRGREAGGGDQKILGAERVLERDPRQCLGSGRLTRCLGTHGNTFSHSEGVRIRENRLPVCGLLRASDRTRRLHTAVPMRSPPSSQASLRESLRICGSAAPRGVRPTESASSSATHVRSCEGCDRMSEPSRCSPRTSHRTQGGRPESTQAWPSSIIQPPIAIGNPGEDHELLY